MKAVNLLIIVLMLAVVALLSACATARGDLAVTSMTFGTEPTVPKITKIKVDPHVEWSFDIETGIAELPPFTYNDQGQVVVWYEVPANMDIRFIHSTDLKTWAYLKPVYEENLGVYERRAVFQQISDPVEGKKSLAHFFKIEY